MKKLLIAIIALYLTACGSIQPQKEYITQTKIIKQEVPEELLEIHKIKEFISREEYLALTPYEREEYLTNYILNLLVQIKIYENQIKKIKEMNNEGKSKD
jgi:hypothetical protein